MAALAGLVALAFHPRAGGMDALSFLPPDIAGWQAAIVIFFSFIGAAMTAATSIGGGLLLIAVMSAFLPAGSVVPVHAVIMIGSNAGRAILLIGHVHWRIWCWFALGAVAGAMVGGQVVVGMPAWAIRLGIAAFILLTQWGPRLPAIGIGKIAYIVTGFLSTILTLFIGATGPFLTAVLAEDRLIRQQIVGTAGMSMTLQHSLKVMVFGLGGFVFGPWALLIATCILAGFVGTFLGTRLLHAIDERIYRQLLKWLLTGIAAYLVVLVGLALA